MAALAQWVVRDAYPLGKPLDGRDRYGMTPEMARVYRWLIENRPHDDWFVLNFRELADDHKHALSNLHMHTISLVERGWLEVITGSSRDTVYRFVHPVMKFNK